MIGDLAKGQDKSNIVLIEDSSDYHGRGVLCSFISSLAERVDEVHIVCYDGRSRDIKSHIDVSRCKIYDGHSDILNWNNTSSLNATIDIIPFLIEKNNIHGNKKIAVVIDSLTQLILYRSASYTCQVIHKLAYTQCLGCEVEQVVCLLHEDLHDHMTSSLVEHTASTIIKMKKPSTDQHTHGCDVFHKKISGKITQITENFSLTDNFEIKDVKEVSTVISLQSSADDSQVDPAANLTFNLTLTDKEKKARSQVKLPYTYDQQRQEDTLSKSVGEGKIFYQPDEIDDFDEEDPDDDLDI
ncbi:Hypothetical predicted protein [Mytilus galloprovincialis]|uniref:Elongator complex protein 5 n=1 Tax=Mytilus galloprovincialis TaxID=29158 RepID=A0A8B6DNJ0_MYTGA|nr:Hypothetical predicted protein [Mytilus galloprovincialis]